MIKKNTNSTEDVRKEMPTEKLCPLSPIRFFFLWKPIQFFFCNGWQLATIRRERRYDDI